MQQRRMAMAMELTSTVSLGTRSISLNEFPQGICIDRDLGILK